ncbi:MAG: hypothetical protein AAF614_14630 [Chloroflexota bacterium]
MIKQTDPRDIRLFKPVLILGLTMVGIVYFLSIINTGGDWLWFQSRGVNVRPDRIRILHYGEETFIQPGHLDYIPLADAVETSLSDFNNTDLINLGLGENTLDYFNDQGVLLELFYDQPVTFRASFRTGEPTQLLVPVEGRHAGHNYFFRGAKGEWWFGAMRMTDSTALFTALREQGYLTN